MTTLIEANEELLDRVRRYKRIVVAAQKMRAHVSRTIPPRCLRGFDKAVQEYDNVVDATMVRRKREGGGK